MWTYVWLIMAIIAVLLGISVYKEFKNSDEKKRKALKVQYLWICAACAITAVLITVVFNDQLKPVSEYLYGERTVVPNMPYD